MDDDGLLGRLWAFLDAKLALWAIFLLNAVAWFKVLNERLRDAASEKGADWERIRNERNTACEERDMVRDRWAQCEAEKNEWMARAVKAEATLQGWGDARQRMAIEDATERVEGRGNGDGESDA